MYKSVMNTKPGARKWSEGRRGVGVGAFKWSRVVPLLPLHEKMQGSRPKRSSPTRVLNPTSRRSSEAYL